MICDSRGEIWPFYHFHMLSFIIQCYHKLASLVIFVSKNRLIYFNSQDHQTHKVMITMVNLEKFMRLVKTMCMMDEEHLSLMSKSQLVLLFHISAVQLQSGQAELYAHSTIHPNRSCRAVCKNTECCNYNLCAQPYFSPPWSQESSVHRKAKLYYVYKHITTF